VRSAAGNSFIELLFDRRKVTAVGTAGGTSTITILQSQAGCVWRTPQFTIPASAKIVPDTAGGTNASGLAKLTVDIHVRIKQAGPIGGPLVVLRALKRSR